MFKYHLKIGKLKIYYKFARVQKKDTMKNLIIKILLAVVVVFLAYMVYDSIITPVKFEKETKRREKVVIERLKDIRTAQLLYKTVNDSFAQNWDTLVNFLKTHQIPIIKRESYVFRDIADTAGATLFNKRIGKKFKSLDDLIKDIRRYEYNFIEFSEDKEDQSVIVRVSQINNYVNAADSLYKDRLDVDHISLIPFSDNKKFDLETGKISKGAVEVNVIEVRAGYEDILTGMNEQLTINLVAKLEQLEKFPGLMFGSMYEPSTEGNWENL